jgi:hypothetical protein
MSINGNGQDPDSYLGVNPVNRPKNIIAQRNPATTDRRYPIGTLWVDRSNNQSWVLTNVAAGSATWALASPGASDVDTLTGDSGGALSPSGGNITLAGGTNITTAGAGSTITFNLDAAISLATSVTSPIYTASAADLNINAAASQDIIVQLGDAAGSNFFIVEDSGGTDQFNIDSDGQVNLLTGNLVESRSAAGAEVLLQVTNSDNTNAASDAFFEAAVGGTSSGNPGIRFQISGGQNYSMGIDNASGSDDLLICGDNDIGTDPLLTMAEAGDVTVNKGNLVLGAVATQLQMNGGAVTDFIGTATLSSGTVTVANTNIAATDRIFIQRQDVNSSTAIGHLTYSISAATSFTITAVQAASPGSTETNDVSIVMYHIIRQN